MPIIPYFLKLPNLMKTLFGETEQDGQCRSALSLHHFSRSDELNFTALSCVTAPHEPHLSQRRRIYIILQTQIHSRRTASAILTRSASVTLNYERCRSLRRSSI